MTVCSRWAMQRTVIPCRLVRIVDWMAASVARSMLAVAGRK